MATLALAAAGAFAGSALLPSGLTLLGATLSGAAIGSQIGAFAGRYIDQTLFASSGQGRTLDGPRLASLHVTASTEGAPIPRLYGTARIGGQVIWASDLEEEVVTGSAGGGSKGGSGGGGAVQTVEYRYYASFAVALAEGEIAGIGRIWADGDELDQTRVTYRLYTGSETQAVDSLIAAKEGAGRAPAFRGTAYIVFERLALATYGNRLPQLSFEVHRPVDDFADSVRGVVLIPGSGEFAYATTPVSQLFGLGSSTAQNVHTRAAATDMLAALDQMEAALPSVGSVSLVVSWFGTDLRAGQCQLVPGVEQADGKTTAPLEWSVAGADRAHAYPVSRRAGRPAYGGTPSDASVVEAIAELKRRGLAVTMNPFVLMDVAEGNALPNPYGGASQPAYPWRGRMTVHPAPGQPGSPDKTAAAASQIASFVGTAAPSHFAVVGAGVIYSGPAEWSYRRMILHNAFLAKAAGGVDAFLIGSELRGLTSVRSAAGTYPFVAALQALAADVKAVLGPSTKVLYSADWTEYFGHQPQDGSGDVYFHLDPLWASSAIDAIGIDAYWPLADWRDGSSHLDAAAGTRSVYDLAYLKANITGGEGYDWYYASDADRAAQIRTSITDGRGKPWVFRTKDIRGWWLNQHFDRPGGVEATSPTAWVPQSKPIWLMEVGCGAVDRGANQPNVFVDPKSAENALPYYSRGHRDDLMQRRYLSALLQAFDPASPGTVAGLNPVSTVYGGRMVPPERIHVYCWDARPYPAFPFDTDTWGDGDNWRLGHWLNGRGAGGGLAETVARLLADYGFADHDAHALVGSVQGFVVDHLMSAREALQPLELSSFFDSVESGGAITFRQRGQEPAVVTLTPDGLVEPRPEQALLTVTRAQETDLPASAKVTYITASGSYDQAVAEARRLSGASGRVAEARLPLVIEPDRAGEIAETWLFEAWAARERAAFALPPSLLAVEPGDAMALVQPDGAHRLVRVTEVGDHGARDIQALSLDPEVYNAPPSRGRAGWVPQLPIVGQPFVVFLDLPLLRDRDPARAGWVAAAQSPWPGGIAVYDSPENAGYTLRASIAAPSVIGTTLDALAAAPIGRFDHAARLRVSVGNATLASASLLQVLAGRNAAAVRTSGGWEVVQFREARLVGSGIYELSGLLRGQAGSDAVMEANLAPGATVVFLGSALARIDLDDGELGLPLSWRAGPGDRDIGDISFTTTTHAFGGVALRPLSPVRVRASRSGGGDIAISWIRRTRIGGDSWDGIDVPLGESREAYEIDVLGAGGAVRRTLTAATASATYSATDQIADFGATQASVALRVYQVSAERGRGAPASAQV